MPEICGYLWDYGKNNGKYVIMGRSNNGTVKQKDGLYYGRVRWTTEDGKKRDFRLKGEKTEVAAWKAVLKKKEELEAGCEVVDGSKLKFSDLAEEYRIAHLYPAKIVNGKKVGGRRSLAGALCNLKALLEFFGKRKVKSIKPSDLERYKQQRLDAPTIHEKQRQIGSVNRELELARTIFNFAIQERYLLVSPFIGKAVIQKSSENKRDRILTDEEEKRLLEACRKKDKYGRNRRLQLIPLLIASWDTAARRGELISLTWKNVDFDAGHYGTITVIAERSKTQTERIIGITPRLRKEMLKLWNESVQDLDSRVFGYECTPKTAFMAACKDAGVENYRWHDGRHTATTRMMEATENAELVKKVTGHTQATTFARYYNPTTESITSVADALSKRNSEKGSGSNK